MMKKQVEFLLKNVFLWGCRPGRNLLLNVIFLLGMVFFVKDALSQNQSANTKKDSKADALRPVVDFVASNSKTPFHNYVKEEMRKIFKEGVKVEKESVIVPANLNIQGLIWGGRLPLAIIESRVLKVGDVINGYTIDKIDRNGVALSANGKFFKLGPPSAAQVNNLAKNKEGGKDAK